MLYDADPRQMKKLLAEVELEGANGAATPGQTVNQHHVEMEEDLLQRELTRFRAPAARARTARLLATLICFTPLRTFSLYVMTVRPAW